MADRALQDKIRYVFFTIDFTKYQNQFHAIGFNIVLGSLGSPVQDATVAKDVVDETKSSFSRLRR